MLDLAITLALGGDCLADIAVLRAEPDVFGLVASDPTVSRAIDRLADQPAAALRAIDVARAAARAVAWRLAGERAPDHGINQGNPLIIDIDATLVTAHSCSCRDRRVRWGASTSSSSSTSTGSGIFEQIARRTFTAEDTDQLRRWEEQLARHTPECIEMIHGWVEGLTARGLPANYDQALAVWTGVDAPMKTYFRYHTGTASPPSGAAPDGHVDEKATGPCSGVAAWGEATTDGRLVVRCSQDHECTFMATIVAFPDDGNAFIYTPFAANGSIPFMGAWFMAGHPGMNSKGLTYVHHGGASAGEPPEQWGYGLRRGAGTMHVLRYADTAEQARAIELSWPVGDSGRSGPSRERRTGSGPTTRGPSCWRHAPAVRMRRSRSSAAAPWTGTAAGTTSSTPRTMRSGRTRDT